MARGPDLSGAVLEGRYQIQEKLAEGAMGVVYKGVRLQLNRPVAIKVMHAALPSAMSARERFEREAKLMALLEHPHCVSVIDSGIYDGKPFVVMELVRGRSLQDMLAEQDTFEIPRAVEIIRQVLSGLAHAHAQGVIHRDIKPANIMVTPKEPLGVHARILDFGLARMLESSASLTDGHAVGTPSYMAPEQCRGDKLDARCDLYACGVVMFEMLTGKKPFIAKDPIAIVKKQLEQMPPRLCDIAGGEFGPLEGVIARALAKSPADRYWSATAMSEAIDAAMGGRNAAQATQALPKQGGSEGSVDIPISVASQVRQIPHDSHDASMLRRMLPRSRMRLVVLLALLVIAGGLYGIYWLKENSAEEIAQRPAPPRPPPVAIDAAVVVVDGEPPLKPVDQTIDDAEQLAQAGRFDAALDLLALSRRHNATEAKLPYAAGRLYFKRMWWNDGIKSLREAIKLDPDLKKDPELIKMVLKGFMTTPDYDERLGSFLAELGAAATPFIDEAAKSPNPNVRARAAAQLRRQH